MRYSARVKGWNIWEHALFPAPLRQAVRAMLLLNAQASNMVLNHRLNNLMLLDSEPTIHQRRPLPTEASYYHVPTSDYLPLDAHNLQATAHVPPGVLLLSMPLYVLYYVMEFMVRSTLSIGIIWTCCI